LGKITDKVFRNCLDEITTCINKGRTGVGIVIVIQGHPHNGGIPVSGNGDAGAEKLTEQIRRATQLPDLPFLRPRRPRTFKYIGRTGIASGAAPVIIPRRPHDGGIPVCGNGHGAAEIVPPTHVRRLKRGLFRPRRPRTDKYIDPIAIPRPHDGGIPISGNGHATANRGSEHAQGGRPALFRPRRPRTGKYIGHTGLIKPGRPHDGGIPISGNGHGGAETVVARRHLEPGFLRPRGPRTGKYIDRTGIGAHPGRPHDGGISIFGNRHRGAKIAVCLPVRRCELLLLRPRCPRTDKYIGRTEMVVSGIIESGGVVVLKRRPHDGGIPVFGYRHAPAELVLPNRVRRPEHGLFRPRRPRTDKYIGLTGVGHTAEKIIILVRPHDGGIPVSGNGYGGAEIVTPL